MNESRFSRVGRNVFSSVLLQFFKIFFVFLNRVIFVKKLGASFLGISGLFTNIIGILSLSDLGITTVMMYCLYEPLAKNDTVTIQKYMNYFKRIYNYIALAVLVVGIILIPFLGLLVNLPEDVPHITFYYFLYLINSVVSYLFVYKTTLLSADQKMYVINKYDSIFQFVLFILQLLVLLLTNSFALYIISTIICTMLSNVLKVNKANKIYPYLKEKNTATLTKSEKKDIFKNLYSLFFYKLGTIIQNNTDNIYISIFVGTIVVGYYSNYCTIISSVTTFLTLIFTSLKATIGNYIAKENVKNQLKLFNMIEEFNFWLVSFCSICFLVLIPDFITICFGKEYLLGTSLLIWIVLNFYTSNIRQTLWAYRETTGVFRKTKHITLVTSSLNLILSLILGYYFGLDGIIGATVLSRMLYAWWKEPLITFKEHFKCSPKQYYLNYCIRFMLFIVLAGVTLFIASLVSISNIFISFILKMFICVIVPNLIFVIIFWNSSSLKYLRNKLLKR